MGDFSSFLYVSNVLRHRNAPPNICSHRNFVGRRFSPHIWRTVSSWPIHFPLDSNDRTGRTICRHCFRMRNKHWTHPKEPWIFRERSTRPNRQMTSIYCLRSMQSECQIEHECGFGANASGKFIARIAFLPAWHTHTHERARSLTESEFWLMNVGPNRHATVRFEMSLFSNYLLGYALLR